jgi:hypothetical protein
MGADAGKEELKYGTLNDYLSSEFICINWVINGNSVVFGKCKKYCFHFCFVSRVVRFYCNKFK